MEEVTCSTAFTTHLVINAQQLDTRIDDVSYLCLLLKNIYINIKYTVNFNISLLHIEFVRFFNKLFSCLVFNSFLVTYKVLSIY